MKICASTTLPSDQEILAVRTTRMEVELLQRDADGNWSTSTAIVHRPETLELTSIGFAAPVTELYRTAGLTR